MVLISHLLGEILDAADTIVVMRDEHGGISAPVGLVGSRLEANVHIVTAGTT